MEIKTEPLSLAQSVEGFDCGEPPLNEYLKRYALQSQSAGAARVYVVVLYGTVAGYYTLSAGSIETGAANPRLLKGLARQPIPIVLLGRLAVDRSQQGRGLGKLLLRDAILRYVQAADIIGARALLVHAKHEKAANFYAGFGFERLPGDSLHMALLQKDARRSMHLIE
jgi:GNAT superfamily N-acetyltransferase